ncbi:MAG: response regulator [Bdellovibrionaceae bacterium]|nr:response regulator [Bdellovibrio sp.]
MKNKELKKLVTKKAISATSFLRLKAANRKLKVERDEARETLRAISSGEVDAFLIETKDGEKVFTLKSAEHAYRVMVEAMNEGAATVLHDGTIIYCNNKFAELLKKSPNFICGEKIWSYIAKRDMAQFNNLFNQSLTKPAKGELFLTDGNGTLIDVHVSLGSVDFNGTNGVSIVVTDLTERKQNEALTISENLTRSILDQAVEAIIVCDTDGFITRANPEAQRLIGINPVLLPFDKAFHLIRENGEPFPLSEMRRSGRRTRSLPVSLKQLNQAVVELSMSISHLENESVGLWHVVTLTDVTPIKRMEKLKAAKEAAESANSLKTSFLANMSHEIRTPLGAIVGFADLMRETTVAPNVSAQYLEIISRSGKALTVLIDDILDLSKVEAGGIVIEHIEIQLAELMDDIAALFSQTTVKKNVTLSVVYDENVPRKLKSDPTRLRQILVNIVGNALKFTEKGEVEVSISVQPHQTKDNQIVFRVRDTGAGLSPEQQKRIFAPFTQGDDSTTRKFGGTGLGLVLSRRLAQALGGDVVLESSKPGVGSVFCITASMNDGVTVISPVLLPFPQSKSIVPMAPPKLQNLNILVVDDSFDNQLLFYSLFTSRGAIVEIACNGREGVDKALAGNYDVVVMDIQMPVLDGYGATKELRSGGYKKPIIALTAYAMKEEKERCVTMGCNAHLSKPINIPLAIDTIVNVVAISKALENREIIPIRDKMEKCSL